MKTTITLHLQACKTSTKLLVKRGFAIYFVPPLLLTFFYWTITVLLPNVIFSGWFEHIQWLNTTLSAMGYIINFILTQLYIFMILVCLSPFHVILSGKIDSHLSDRLFLSTPKQVLYDLIRMIGVVFIALTLQLFAISFWWIFAHVTFLHTTFIYETITFLISAFFISFSFYDYSLERHRIGVIASLKFAFTNWKIVLLTGIVFKFLYNFPYLEELPYVGMIIAPIFTTALSTVIYHMKTSNDRSLHSVF